MGMSINTNVVSLNAQRNLSLSGNSLATTMQRLSSGLRVNSAKDDAAGLAISERMTTQVKGLVVAARNSNDGISLAQTAEGALGKVGDMLQRMRELAVQSGNATNSTSDREALQSELSQLRDEVDRVAKTTSFNGTKLLDGGFTGAVFQVGANAGDNITVGALANTKTANLGTSVYGAADLTGVNSTAVTGLAGATTVSVTVVGANGVTHTSTFELNAKHTNLEALGKVVETINSKTADTGLTVFLEKKDDNYSISYRNTAANDTTTIAAATVTVAGVNFASNFSTSTTTIEADKQTGLDEVSIKTQAGAWEALQRIDSAINKVNTARADLGAIQTRFEKAVENIDIQSENISAARGRIIDTDFANETANLSRSQILQQAGTAMVAQANQLPQSVLSLLR